MSDKPDIEAIKARLARCKKGAWGFYNAEDYRGKGTEDWTADPIFDIATLLAEVERLQRERSEWCDQADRRLTEQMTQQRDLLAENERLQRERSEWCDQADRRLTDYMTQQRDLLAENAALRARLTLTPERIEAAAKAIAALHESPCWDNCYEESWPDADVAARAALLAAGMEEAEQ